MTITSSAAPNVVACYFDASYDQPTTVTAVSGWIGTVNSWERFDTDWKILLASFDLPYFHMREFAHSRGAFKKGWKGEENKRALFLSRAVDIIRANVLYGLGCIVDHVGFENVSKSTSKLRAIVGNPYALAGRDCVAHANLYLKRDERGLGVQYIFEDGDGGKGELLRIMKRDELPAPIFAPSINTSNGVVGLTPLQAADFAAYELLKGYRTGDNLPIYKYRRSLFELAKIQGWWGRYSERDLRDLCRRAIAVVG